MLSSERNILRRLEFAVCTRSKKEDMKHKTADAKAQVTRFALDVSRRTLMAWVQLVLLMLVAIALPGCEVVGGIFKAGAWVGALAVILVIVIVGIVAAKIRG
jgi:hypothetical protein